jgi:hypothetical protein
MGKTMETPWEKPWKSMGKAMEHYDEELYLVGDWNHGMDYDFPYIQLGMEKSAQLTKSYFSEG